MEKVVLIIIELYYIIMQVNLLGIMTRLGIKYKQHLIPGEVADPVTYGIQ